MNTGNGKISVSFETPIERAPSVKDPTVIVIVTVIVIFSWITLSKGERCNEVNTNP